MAGNAGYSPRLFSLLSDHIIDYGGVNIVKLYNTSYTTRSVKPVFIAINDDSLHHIKLFGYWIYSVTSLPALLRRRNFYGGIFGSLQSLK